MKNRKKILPVIVLTGLLTLGAVWAYFTDTDSAGNRILIGENTSSITETFTPLSEINPGDVIPKNVSVYNNGPCSCFVRVKVVFSDSDMEQYCTVDWNKKDWTYHNEDGYYYYHTAVEKDMETTSLFTKIKISDSAPTEQIRPFQIIVYEESCQQGTYAADAYEAAWTQYTKNRPK